MNQLGILRDIASDELGLMRAWRNNPQVRANMYTRHEISEAEHLAWWARTQERADQKYFMYAYQGVPAGITAFTQIDSVSRNATWAFYASPAAPKGSGSRMEYLMLEYAFGTLGLHKLQCEVLAFNSAVIRLHQKFAFQVEGILREQHLGADGFVDVYRLGLLQSEWTQHRQGMRERLLQPVPSTKS